MDEGKCAGAKLGGPHVLGGWNKTGGVGMERSYLLLERFGSNMDQGRRAVAVLEKSRVLGRWIEADRSGIFGGRCEPWAALSLHGLRGPLASGLRTEHQLVLHGFFG